MVSASAIGRHLNLFYHVREQDIRIYRYKFTSFLLTFSDRSLADRVLHAAALMGTDLMLVFQRWQWLMGALLSSLRCKVLLMIENIPAHLWSVDTACTILGTSCIVSEASPRSWNRIDMSRFLVEAWAAHLDFIPMEVGCIVLEPELPFIGRAPPLFLF
jgi:hypothetical protein